MSAPSTVSRIAALVLLLPGIVAAQQAHAPKLVPALGWDRATQGSFTTSVTVDAQNNVWVGTEGKGVWRYSPREKKWTQFTGKDGLGDDDIYALAVDKLGRIWAGHLNHGVSVWNGEKWKNYSIVDGPLGSRVFAIATCPTDGDVWIATDCGVARYSLAKDDWDYFTRASGLPSDQFQALAFDAKGNIYLGTQCDGIAIASAKDNYQKWTTVAGLPKMQNASDGTGLASSLINGIIVAAAPKNGHSDGTDTLIAATPLGLSTSSDYGGHFNFIRGEDWQENVKGLYEPPKPPDQPASKGAALLMEDWVTCVHQEEGTGRLWIGYRQKGLEIRTADLAPDTSFDLEGHKSLEVRSIWTGVKAPALIAVYDDEQGGLKTPDDSAASVEPVDAPATQAPALPSPAKAPTAEAIEPLIKRLDAFKNEIKPGDAIFLGDDWNTRGDWVAHYGTSFAMLNSQERYESEAGFSATVDLGPHHNEGEEASYHTEDTATEDPGVLYYPTLGRRDEQEVNDLSYEDTYPSSWEGPDLWVNVEVPEGVHTVSLYFQNYDGQTGGDNKLRDYEIEVLQSAETQELALKQTPLAHARATDFLGGVYKQFAVAGPAKYVFRIKRNRSYVTKLLGLFVDRVVIDPSVKKTPLPGFEDVKYAQPEMPDDFEIPADNPTLSAATDLWDKMVDLADKRGVLSLQIPLCIWSYRAAVASKAPPELLGDWRWQMCIWTQEDRAAFKKATEEAFKAYSAKHPQAKQGAPAMITPY